MSPDAPAAEVAVNEACVDQSRRTGAAALFGECGADAVEAVSDMARRVLLLANQFRLADVQAGHAGLADLAGDLRALVTLLEAMMALPGFDPAWLTIDAVGPRDQIERLGRWLGALVGAQAEADWLTVADILEYDLAPALRAWELRLGDGVASVGIG